VGCGRFALWHKVIRQPWVVVRLSRHVRNAEQIMSDFLIRCFDGNQGRHPNLDDLLSNHVARPERIAREARRG